MQHWLVMLKVLKMKLIQKSKEPLEDMNINQEEQYINWKGILLDSKENKKELIETISMIFLMNQVLIV